MKLRTLRTYRCRSGKRFVRLYRAWGNMRGRASGRICNGSGNPTWAGMQVEWQTFDEFRTWALANGYSKLRCSLDRRHPDEGYTSKNCRWLTVYENSMRALYGDDPLQMGGKCVTSDECPF